MSIQTKIENAIFNTKKKLYDNHIRIKGIEIKCIRLSSTQDKYGDDLTLDIISNNEIIVYLDTLSIEIPLNRYRLDSTDNTIDSESVFLFEILPISLYAQWTDELETGDILILLLKDYVADIDIPVVFRVSDVLGRFQKNLLFRKYNIAPYNPSNIDSSVRTLILNYINSN